MALKCTKNYLTNRYQNVKCENKLSTEKMIVNGFLRGAFLSPSSSDTWYVTAALTCKDKKLCSSWFMPFASTLNI